MILLDLADDFNVVARHQKVSFSHMIPENLPVFSGDAMIFDRAVLTLLNNALMHGGPIMTDIASNVSMSDDNVSITVQDNGKRIAGDDMRRAMARFGQVTPSAGSGLGQQAFSTASMKSTTSAPHLYRLAFRLL